MAISPLRILIILAFWSLGSSFCIKTKKKKKKCFLHLDREKKIEEQFNSGFHFTVSADFPAGELPALSSVSIASLSD